MNLIKKIPTFVIPIILTIIATSLLIYLTPLKNIALIEPTVKDIDPQIFYNDYVKNKDKYLFIDVRPTAMYEKIHAEGSKNIQLHEMYYEHKNLPKHGKEIVLICSGGLASGVAYSYLQHYGFFNIVRIEGGIENWQNKKLPVVSQIKI